MSQFSDAVGRPARSANKGRDAAVERGRDNVGRGGGHGQVEDNVSSVDAVDRIGRPDSGVQLEVVSLRDQPLRKTAHSACRADNGDPADHALHARRRSLLGVPRYVPTPVDDPVAAELLGEYFSSRELGFTGGTYRLVTPDPSAFAPPAGIFLVVLDDDTAVGCGGVRMITPYPGSEPRGEVKHLWLRAGFRGRGWGRGLLAELESRAVELGARTVVLDTNATLEAAQSLYRASGYTKIDPYNDNPNATHWFAKPLAGG